MDLLVILLAHFLATRRRGGTWTMTSKKLSRMPLLHFRLLLRQLMHAGSVSSHLRCRSLQVRQPVLTRLDFAGIKAAIGFGLPAVSMTSCFAGSRISPIIGCGFCFGETGFCELGRMNYTTQNPTFVNKSTIH